MISQAVDGSLSILSGRRDRDRERAAEPVDVELAEHESRHESDDDDSGSHGDPSVADQSDLVPATLRSWLVTDCRHEPVSIPETVGGYVETIAVSDPELFAALLHPARQSAAYHRVKRVIDVAAASMLLLITAPLIATIAVMIKLDSRGPVIFRQQRIGKDLRNFTFLKFRTMSHDARREFPTRYRYAYDAEHLRAEFFKDGDDPRLTRVGRRIRRTSLDELPNLLSVLRGDMSLVGPRPEIPEMLPYYRPVELCKFGVLPGVTGLAQVSGRNFLRWGETNALDVEYVHRRSTGRDLGIMCRTLLAVVGMVGAL